MPHTILGTHVSTEKKMHNLKVENYVLFGRFSEDLSQKTASKIGWRDSSKEVREEPEYIGVLP